MISAFCILTYNLKKIQEMNENDVELILTSRKLIADNFNFIPKICLPSRIYYEITQTMNDLDFLINKIVSNNPQILEKIYGSDSECANLSYFKAQGMNPFFKKKKNLSWSKDNSRNCFIKDSYSVILSQGLLFKNGLQSGQLPQQIMDNLDYKELYGKQMEIFKFFIQNDNVIFPGTNIKTSNFETLTKDIIIWMLDVDFNNICIQEKRNSDQYCTFVSSRFLKNYLPLALITDYTHWFIDNKIIIKDSKNENKYEIQIKNDQGEIISSNQDSKNLVPFENLNEKLQNIFINFEDKQFILILEDKTDKNNYTILLPRLNLTFFCDSQNNCIKSLDYLNYVLRVNQNTNIFPNFKNYLIIEPLENPKYNLKLNQKILIPHRQIK